MTSGATTPSSSAPTHPLHLCLLSLHYHQPGAHKEKKRYKKRQRQRQRQRQRRMRRHTEEMKEKGKEEE